MTKHEKMDDDQLLTLLRQKESDASAYVHGQLGNARETAMREYHRMPYGNEEDGMSQVITSDVQDSVEWILPALLKIFTGTDKAVSFEPTRATETEGAEQATDACNYVFYKQNNGFLILYTAIKDMLTVRNCAVMWRKETQSVVSSMPFKGATQEMIAMLLKEKDTEIESATQVEVMGPDGLPIRVYNGRIKRTEKKTICKVETFSPEDLLVERDWVTPILADCPYVCRLMRVTASDIKMMGLDVDPEELEASDSSGNPVNSSARLSAVNRDDGTIAFSDDTPLDDDSMAEGWLRIEYVLADVDGDGVAERICVYRLQDKILSQEVCSHVPIATASPILNTHRWDGQSIWDLVRDIQQIHSELLRQMFNNLYLTNNPRTKVLTDNNWSPLANIDDLLNSRPGGILRQQNPEAISEQVIPYAAGASMPMLEYVQGMRENRTGVSRTSMGLNPDSLNNTATGRTLDQSSAMQRIELIARIIAETLVKPIFQGILKVLTDGEMEKLAFRLRDKFVEYDPNEWRDQYDMSINVGLGSGDTMAQGQKLVNIYQMQQAAMPMGLVTPQHIYHTLTKIVENAGFKDVQNYVQDPAKAPPQQPQTPLPVTIKQMEIQAEAQRFQAESQQEITIEKAKFDAKMQELQANLSLQATNDARDSEREIQKAQMDAQLAAQQLEFDKWKAEFDAQNKIYIEEMKIRGMPPSDAIQEQSNMTQVLSGLQAVIEKMSAPKVIVRDANGRAVGVTAAI